MIRYLALIGLLGAPPSQPAALACYTPDEMRDMIIVAFPAALDIAIDRCRSTLGSSAFIMTDSGKAFVERMRAEALPRKAGVVASFRRVLRGGGIAPEKIEAETVDTMYASFIATVASIQPDQCRDFNSFVEAIAPLPPSNIGAAITATYGLVVRRNKGVLCRP